MDLQTLPESTVDATLETILEDSADSTMPLSSFVSTFGPALLGAVSEQNPPVYNNQLNFRRSQILANLTRKPFEAQEHRIQAGATLLLDEDQRAFILNGEMGTGKTMMAIALSVLTHEEGYERSLVICPPHLVYKWRREIKQTVPNAVVWILNGPDTLRKLLQLRAMHKKPTVPTYFIMGRVRMRMGFDWQPSFSTRLGSVGQADGSTTLIKVACCPRCGTEICAPDVDGAPQPMTPIEARSKLSDKQAKCVKCNEALWSLKRPTAQARSAEDVLTDALKQIPTIGEKTASRLLKTFGTKRIGAMLEDNVYELLNLMDEDGDLIFTDRQFKRMERAMATTEFSFGTGGYQPSEFIKRYLPKGFFGTLIADEGHEYKNDGSAQGQAFGVLASQCRKAVLLTGTLMGGYADDLFYLLWRLDPSMMIEDGFTPHRGSLGSAGLSFMREHGVIKDVYKEVSSGQERSHRTAKGKSRIAHRVSKAPGFGPTGIMRYVLPITAFLKLKDIGGNILPPYTERFVGVEMSPEQAEAYNIMAARLKDALAKALRCGDKTLMGVVLNVLLAWPDCSFRSELVYHPRTRALLASAPPIFNEATEAPKEEELIRICKEAKSRGRKILVYTSYTGTRDTTSRLKVLLETAGFKTAVLKASVEAAKREDWLLEKVDQGYDIIVTNPELVKTGLDMLEFPTIVFMQCGYNVYTLQQAARRSWRIGQRLAVEIWYLGYQLTAQMNCLELMAKKIAVSQSTSGDMPESGLDVLNDSGDSVEVALAKQLLV